MEKHPLHIKIPDLQTYSEVVRAVSKKERLTGEGIPNNPKERIEVYLDRLENIFLNPDERVRKRNLKKAKVFIPDLSQFKGKPLYEVIQYVVDTYGSKYKIPGLEYRDFLVDNPKKSPQELKDTNPYFFFPGSVFRDSSGVWLTPCTSWRGSGWNRNDCWLGLGWGFNFRFVLLEI